MGWAYSCMVMVSPQDGFTFGLLASTCLLFLWYKLVVKGSDSAQTVGAIALAASGLSVSLFRAMSHYNYRVWPSNDCGLGPTEKLIEFAKTPRPLKEEKVFVLNVFKVFASLARVTPANLPLPDSEPKTSHQAQAPANPGVGQLQLQLVFKDSSLFSAWPTLLESLSSQAKHRSLLLFSWQNIHVSQASRLQNLKSL